MTNIDGICEECGNSGFVGEICSFCGSKIEALDKDLERYEHDEMPIVPKAKARKSDVFDDPDLDDIDMDDDLEDVDEFADEDEKSSTDVSMEDLAEKENKAEDKEGWFDPDSLNNDDDA